MLSIEELLYPRYKVIAPYPGMHVEPFNLHQIVILQPHKEEDAEGFIYIPNKHMPVSFMWQSFFHLFPHLFKELAWWEERELDDLPKYIKKGNETIVGVLYYDYSSEGELYLVSDDAEIPNYMDYLSPQPATKEEYENYIKQK